MRNVDLFEIVGHRGFYKCNGVCGSLTGTPVDIAIIDDPVKDALEAYSPVYRDRVWEWYTSVLMTRLHNESRQLFIMTRWHEDDLAGRILKNEPENWTVLSIPAIRETLDDGNTFDPRNVGDALWEERHSLRSLKEQEKRSARMFSALYQQRPTVEGGNIIKESWFKRISRTEYNKVCHGKPIVFFLGRHVEYKGIKYLLEAERFVRQDCVFLIAGQGPLTAHLKEQYHSSRLHWLGRISEEEKRYYYHAASIFAFPSITRNEAFGIVLAEAMYCKCPTVTFTIKGSGVNWVSLNGETGIEVANSDFQAYAQAVDKLLQDNILRDKMGRNAKKRVVSLFTRDVVAKQYQELYEKFGYKCD